MSMSPTWTAVLDSEHLECIQKRPRITRDRKARDPESTEKGCGPVPTPTASCVTLVLIL